MKYLFGVLGFIVLTVIAIVLLVSATNNRRPDTTEGERVVNLADYIDNSATVTFTAKGRVVAEEDYREIVISVTPTERRVAVIKGYNGAVDKQQTFPNSQEAYEAFLHALSKTGFTVERETNNKDIEGACPTGRRYLYELDDNGSEIVDLWSTTCNSNEGTFAGNDNTTQRLFRAQIPGYSKFVSGVRL